MKTLNTLFMFLLNLNLILQAQVKNDTLKWEICGNYDFSNNTLENLDNKVYDIKNNSYLLVTICLDNVSEDSYLKGSYIAYSFTLTFPNEEDTSLIRPYYFDIDFSPSTEDTVFIVLDKVKIILNDTGTYTMKAKVLSTEKDGLFSDSIQELSSRTSLFYVINSSGINERNFKKYNLFPNPASDQLNINAFEANIQDVVMCDMMGKELRRYSINDNSATLDVSALHSGLYVLKIKTEEGLLTRKVQILR